MPKTNVSVERNFRMLDRAMKCKPKANTNCLESIIMYSKTKTGKWLSNLSNEKRTKFMKAARKQKRVQKQKYAMRAKKIWESREKAIRDKRKIS